MKFVLINKRNDKMNFFHNVNHKYVEQKPKQVQPIINNSNSNVKNIRNMFSLLKSANGGGCGSCGGAR